MNKLKELRKNKKKKQMEVAQELGFPRDTLVQYENDHIMPSRKRLEQMAEYYGVTVDYLLGREKPRFAVLESEQRLVEKYRRLTPTHQKQIESNIDFLLTEEEATKKAGLFA